MYRVQDKYNPVAILQFVLLQCGMDDRLTALETKIAYLEDMVTTLNDLVIAHGRELDFLHANKDRLEARLAELAEIAGDIPNRTPPHY